MEELLTSHGKSLTNVELQELDEHRTKQEAKDAEDGEPEKLLGKKDKVMPTGCCVMHSSSSLKTTLIWNEAQEFFFVYIVEARMRANTPCTARGAGDKRGGRGKAKTVGNRHIRRSVEGRGMGRGTRGYTTWTLQGLSGRKAGNLKEVGLGWINGARKDRGFGWRKIRGNGEQLF